MVIFLFPANNRLFIHSTQISRAMEQLLQEYEDVIVQGTADEEIVYGIHASMHARYCTLFYSPIECTQAAASLSSTAVDLGRHG